MEPPVATTSPQRPVSYGSVKDPQTDRTGNDPHMGLQMIPKILNGMDLYQRKVETRFHKKACFIIKKEYSTLGFLVYEGY